MSDNNNNKSLYPTRLDIPAESRSGGRAILNQTLAAILDLKTQVKQAQWSIFLERCGSQPWGDWRWEQHHSGKIGWRRARR